MSRSPRRLLLSAVAVVAAATTGILFTPGAALADIGYVYTDNGAGSAYFQSYGEHLYACDEAADGLRAIAQLNVNGHIYEVQDADGANGNCWTINLSITEGTLVTLRACLRNGASGALQHCSGWRQGTA